MNRSVDHLAILGIFMVSLVSACDRGDAPAVGPVPHERLASSEARARGRALYRQHCAICHGQRADGRGVRQAGMQPADFTSASWHAQSTAEDVFRAIRHGVRGTAMPAWPALEDEQIWDLVAYLRSVHEEGP